MPSTPSSTAFLASCTDCIPFTKNGLSPLMVFHFFMILGRSFQEKAFPEIIGR